MKNLLDDYANEAVLLVEPCSAQRVLAYLPKWDVYPLLLQKVSGIQVLVHPVPVKRIMSLEKLQNP